MKRVIWTGVLGAVLSLSFGVYASADQFDDGMAAYQAGDYSTALKLWQPLADGGDARAQTDLGNMYHDGHGVTQDDTEALKWYRKAADQGLDVAQYMLGVMYHEAWGVTADYAEAASWFRKAADHGFAEAQYNLGYAYRIGQGVPEDYVQAYMWLTLAAAANVEDAASERDAAASQMTAEQIDEAKKLASSWVPKENP